MEGGSEEMLTEEEDENDEGYVQQVVVNSSESFSTFQSGYDSDKLFLENFSFRLASIFQERVSTPESYFCRICHERNLPEPNLSPCHCRGSMAFIHRSCLERWLAASDSTSCELCGFKYLVKRKPKYHFMKAVSIWLKDEECEQDRMFLVLDTIRLIAILPQILLTNHLTTSLLDFFQIDHIDVCDLFSFFNDSSFAADDLAISVGRMFTYFIVGAVSAMDILLIGWAFMRFENHYYQWRRWYRAQCVVSVLFP